MATASIGHGSQILGNHSVVFSGIDHKDPPRNIRICEARYENRLDAGEIFNPDWLEIVHKGSGVIRFMDWQQTNFNINTLRYSDIPADKYCFYGGQTNQPLTKGGMPLSIMSTLANRVQSHPWVCIPTILGTRKLSLITNISNGNPAIVTSPGHKWENGDQLILYLTYWSKLDRRRCTVSHSDQTSGTFELVDVDSTDFGLFKSDLASASAPIDPASITKELTQFATHFRDNLTPGLITYFEFGNELWNFAFPAPHWLMAQARDKFGQDDNYLMAGYLAAHVMRVIRDVYGPERRDKWRGRLATQTVNVEVTRRAISGAKKYLEENAPSLNINDLFNDVAVTGYFGANLTKDYSSAVMDWVNLSEQRWKDGSEQTKYSYFNRTE